MTTKHALLIQVLVSFCVLSCDGARSIDVDVGAVPDTGRPDAALDASADLARDLDLAPGERGDLGSPLNLTGTWYGSYTATVAPGSTYWLEFVLVQSGDQLTGNVTTQNNRAATVTGTVSGDTVSMNMTYTDQCSGSATATGQMPDADTIVGTFSSDDCYGQYSGQFTVKRQTP